MESEPRQSLTTSEGGFESWFPAVYPLSPNGSYKLRHAVEDDLFLRNGLTPGNDHQRKEQHPHLVLVSGRRTNQSRGELSISLGKDFHYARDSQSNRSHER